MGVRILNSLVQAGNLLRLCAILRTSQLRTSRTARTTYGSEDLLCWEVAGRRFTL